MPNYDYYCSNCDSVFEKKLPMTENEKPISEPCPGCNFTGKIEQYLPTAPGIGDPIRLGVTRPPDAFLHGVLGRMASSVPDGGVERDSSGRIKIGSDGKPKKKYVNFTKAHYQPGRLV